MNTPPPPAIHQPAMMCQGNQVVQLKDEAQYYRGYAYTWYLRWKDESTKNKQLEILLKLKDAKHVTD